MNEKVIGKSNHVLAYFGALHAIIATVSLVLFIAQLVTSSQDVTASIFSREMLYLQLSLLGMLLPSVAFCSYLSLGLKLNSRFYRRAMTVSAVMVLPIFPVVSLLGFYLSPLVVNS
jgi:hypothetical protein